MNLKNRIIALTTVAALAIPAVAIAKHKFSPKEGVAAKAKIDVKLTAGSFSGETADVTMTEDGGNYVVKVTMNRINTGMGLRNQHLMTKLLCQKVERNKELDEEDDKKFLEACKKGTYVAVLTVPKDAVAKKKNIPAKMTINGVTKDVTVNIDEEKKTGDRTVVTATTNIKYTDYYKEVCYKVMCAKPDVKITATLPFEIL